jgi:hypothetical protein
MTNKEAIDDLEQIKEFLEDWSLDKEPIDHAIEVLKTIPNEIKSGEMFDFVRVNALRNLDDEQRKSLALSLLNAVEVKESIISIQGKKLYAIPNKINYPS